MDVQLIQAAQHGDVEGVRAALSAGVDVDVHIDSNVCCVWVRMYVVCCMLMWISKLIEYVFVTVRPSMFSFIKRMTVALTEICEKNLKFVFLD